MTPSVIVMTSRSQGATMLERTTPRSMPGHEVVEILRAEPAEPYDRLVLREPSGERKVWTVLWWEREDERWRITAIRCQPTCKVHRKRR
jgi:hypothetical protein